jgi:hypothetical protein
MTRRDWFVLALRSFGVWELLLMFNDVVSIINVTAQFTRLEHNSLGTFFVHAFGSLLVSMWLLKFAPSIAAFFDHGQHQDVQAEFNRPSVSPEHILVVAMRVIGILQLLRAFEYWVEALDIYFGYFVPPNTTIGACFTHVVVYTGLGIYLLLGPDHIVRSLRLEGSDAVR